MIYKGKWNRNLKEGEGQEEWLTSGDKFKGSYLNGLR